MREDDFEQKSLCQYEWIQFDVNRHRVGMEIIVLRMCVYRILVQFLLRAQMQTNRFFLRRCAFP